MQRGPSHASGLTLRYSGPEWDFFKTDRKAAHGRSMAEVARQVDFNGAVVQGSQFRGHFIGKELQVLDGFLTYTNGDGLFRHARSLSNNRALC